MNSIFTTVNMYCVIYDRDTWNDPTMIMVIIINILLTFTCNFFFHCSKAMQAMFVSQVHLTQHNHVFLLFSICVCRDLPPGKV